MPEASAHGRRVFVTCLEASDRTDLCFEEVEGGQEGLDSLIWCITYLCRDDLSDVLQLRAGIL